MNLTLFKYSDPKFRLSLLNVFFGNESKKFIEAGNNECKETECDTFNPDCSIRISNAVTFNFLPNQLFFGFVTEKSKTGLSILESPARFCV